MSSGLRPVFADSYHLNCYTYALMQVNRRSRAAATPADEPEHTRLELKHRRAVRARCEMSLNLILLHLGKFAVEIGVQPFQRFLTSHHGSLPLVPALYACALLRRVRFHALRCRGRLWWHCIPIAPCAEVATRHRVIP